MGRLAEGNKVLLIAVSRPNVVRRGSERAEEFEGELNKVADVNVIAGRMMIKNLRIKKGKPSVVS